MTLSSGLVNYGLGAIINYIKFGGYTYERIAEMEGCTKMAVKFSIDIAVKKLGENF